MLRSSCRFALCSLARFGAGRVSVTGNGVQQDAPLLCMLCGGITAADWDIPTFVEVHTTRVLHLPNRQMNCELPETAQLSLESCKTPGVGGSATVHQHTGHNSNTGTCAFLPHET